MARVAKIKIKKFKSHKEYVLEIDLNHQHIVIYGDNGVGKTNLIESLSFFSNSKGLRGDSLEKILPEQDLNIVDTKVETKIFSNANQYDFSYKIKKDQDNLKKDFYLNDKKITLPKIKEIISFIWLSPYMDKIMYEGQSIKRSFIDKMISQNEKNFNLSLSSYKKNISERLHILKNLKDDKWLNILEEKLAEDIYEIFYMRRNYANKINQIISENLKQFRDVNIRYENKLFDVSNEKDQNIEIFLEKLKSNRELDEITKRTNFGINKDEIIFFDNINQRNTDSCSTGEQKSSLLTIILANCWKLKKERKDFILLLDEATSHIDDQNFEKLVTEVEKFDTQIWYTGTSKNLFQVVENKGFFIHLQ